VRPYLKKPITKKGWWSGSKCSPEFKPQYLPKKKKRERERKCIALLINFTITFATKKKKET
jgi:hypothetical protein